MRCTKLNLRVRQAGCRCCVRKRSLLCLRPKCAGCSSLTLLPAYRLRLSDASSVALMCRRSCLRASWRDAAWAFLLERVRHTQPLYELKPEERKQELAGCFALLPHTKVRGKHVLLCDDIYTTGSTFAEAAQVLLDAGAARVSALALCAAQANWE